MHAYGWTFPMPRNAYGSRWTGKLLGAFYDSCILDILPYSNITIGQPSSLVEMWTYDWKIGNLSENLLHETAYSTQFYNQLGLQDTF